MGGNVLKKLRSRKGASLTFALLAFLVCAVISAVLLASASASAGRVSDLAEMDQRYYAVTSAAQLFCDTLANDNEYTITRTCEVETLKEIYYVLSESGFTPTNPTAEPQTKSTKHFLEYSVTNKTDSSMSVAPQIISSEDLVDNIKTRITNPDLLTEIALSYIFGDYDEKIGAVLGPSFVRDSETGAYPQIGNAKDWEMTLAVTGAPSLTVDVLMELDLRGNVVVRFTNHQDSSIAADKKKIYSVEVTLGASIEDNSQNPTVKSRPETTITWADNGSGYTESVKTTIETTKTTTISWSVTDISKVTEFTAGSSNGDGSNGDGNNGDGNNGDGNNGDGNNGDGNNGDGNNGDGNNGDGNNGDGGSEGGQT